MPEWLRDIESWYMGFALLGLWLCFGVILHYIQQSRRQRREARQQAEREAWRKIGGETIEDLQRKFGKPPEE